MPTSNETLVRVEDFAKIMPTLFPSKGFGAPGLPRPSFSSAARLMILSKSACQKIGKTQIEGFATVKTVAGEKCMPVVKFDSVKVGNVPKNALGAMSDAVFGDYDVILQNSMF